MFYCCAVFNTLLWYYIKFAVNISFRFPILPFLPPLGAIMVGQMFFAQALVFF